LKVRGTQFVLFHFLQFLENSLHKAKNGAEMSRLMEIRGLLASKVEKIAKQSNFPIEIIV